jgi:hypothetical protein
MAILSFIFGRFGNSRRQLDSDIANLDISRLPPLHMLPFAVLDPRWREHRDQELVRMTVVAAQERSSGKAEISYFVRSQPMRASVAEPDI